MNSLPARPPERSANIFINYRREDSAGHAGRLWLASVAIAVCAMAQAGGPLHAQADPRALQARAIQRIDAFIAHFRQTGEFQSRMADLAQADAELAASNQALTERGDWSTLATGLIKRGTVHRMQGDWATAVGLYRQAVSAAERVKDV